MTFFELHKILDDENYKISVDDFANIVYCLKCDIWSEYCRESDKDNADNYKLAFYDGEINAFYLILDLLEHVI